MMRLYKQYLEEREGAKLIENEHAFISYIIEGKECFIKDTFVEKEFRGEGHFRDLFEIMSLDAKENECEYVTGIAHLNDKNCDDTVAKVMRMGFKFVEAGNNMIKLAYKIGGI